MLAARLLALALAAVVAACGGSNGGSNAPSSQPLSITLVETGSFPVFIPPATVAGFRLLNSLAEYDAFPQDARECPLSSTWCGAPYKPTELRTLDFTQFSVMYVEGPADDFLGATVRLAEIRRTDEARDSVMAERCTLNPNGVPTPNFAYRPYAFYIVPKLLATTTYAWTSATSPACGTASPVPFTFVAAGEFGGPEWTGEWPSSPLAIRTQAELNYLLPYFAPGTIPPQYLAPDFSQVTLLYVTGVADFYLDSYVRVDRVLLNDDGSRDVIAEYCGAHIDRLGAPVNHISFALYAVPRFTGEVRLTVIPHPVGTCILPP